MSDFSEIKVEIEAFVQARKTAKATSLIQKHARQLSVRDEDFLLTLNWLRRLGLHRKAFLMAKKQYEKSSATKNARAARVHSWMARFYYGLGANPFALKILTESKKNSKAPEDQIFLAELYLAEFDFNKALKIYEDFFRVNADDFSYTARILRLGLCDCLAGLRRFHEAYELLELVQKKTSEPLLLGIIESCFGEYLCREAKFKEALPHLLQASKLIPEEDSSLDRGLLLKWWGYALAQAGQKEKGLRLLRQSAELFKKIKFRPEAYLDILRLILEISPDAEDFILLHRYPGLSTGFRAQLGSRPASIPAIHPRPYFIFKPASDEFYFKNQWFIGIPKEIQLAQLIFESGSVGIPEVRVMSLLWPDEVYAYNQLEDRLEKLISRLKTKYKLVISKKESLLKLSSSQLKKMQMNEGEGLQILRLIPNPSARDLAEFYDVSKSQAAKLAWRLRPAGNKA